jgi:hypothetical protein
MLTLIKEVLSTMKMRKAFQQQEEVQYKELCHLVQSKVGIRKAIAEQEDCVCRLRYEKEELRLRLKEEPEYEGLLESYDKDTAQLEHLRKSYHEFERDFVAELSSAHSKLDKIKDDEEEVSRKLQHIHNRQFVLNSYTESTGSQIAIIQKKIAEYNESRESPYYHDSVRKHWIYGTDPEMLLLHNERLAMTEKMESHVLAIAALEEELTQLNTRKRELARLELSQRSVIVGIHHSKDLRRDMISHGQTKESIHKFLALAEKKVEDSRKALYSYVRTYLGKYRNTAAYHAYLSNKRDLEVEQRMDDLHKEELLTYFNKENVEKRKVSFEKDWKKS